MKIISILLLTLLASCASVHNGEYAQRIDKGQLKDTTDKDSPITVSGQEVVGLSSEHFAHFDLTFENNTNEWITINDLDISFGTKLDGIVKIPVGEKLYYWQKAAVQRLEIAQHNTQMAMSALTIGAAALAGGASYNGNRKLSKVAMGAMAFSGTAMTFQEIQKEIDQIELSELVPENHILHLPIYLPPKLHVKKQFTIYVKNPSEIPYIQSFILNYKANDKKDKVLLNIRNGSEFSEFQRIDMAGR